jgi:hypothetical protein
VVQPARCGLALALLLLVGCTDRAETSASSRRSTPSASALPGCDPLPRGVHLDFTTVARSDSFFRTRTGDVRRRVSMQFLDEDATSVLTATTRTLEDAGFSVVSTPGAGANVKVFEMNGYGMVTVGVRPLPHRPDGVRVYGTVTFDLPASSHSDQSSASCPPPEHPGLLRGEDP